MRTVVGLFENANEARLTIAELTELGLSSQDISVLTNVTAQPAIESSGRALMHRMQLDDVGPVAACGPLGAALERPGAPRDLSGALEDFGFSSELARHYVSGIEGGATLETVTVEEADADSVAAIMKRHAGRTMPADERGREREGLGATAIGGSAAEDAGMTRTVGRAVESRLESERRTGSHADGHTFMEEEQTIPIYKEELRVGKREVERGATRVTTHVMEKPYAEKIVLREEHIEVERRPADRLLKPEEYDFGERKVEMIELAEEAVGAKQTRLVEEVIIHKYVDDRTETVGDTLRSTEAYVETFDASKYRDSFDKQMLGGTTFDEHIPALRFGEELRRERSAGARWEEIEADARARWEAKRPGTFETFKESIRHAWSRGG